MMEYLMHAKAAIHLAQLVMDHLILIADHVRMAEYCRSILLRIPAENV